MSLVILSEARFVIRHSSLVILSEARFVILFASDGRTVGLGPGYYLDIVKHFRLPESLKDGTYVMHFVSRPRDDDRVSWQPVYEALHAEVTVTVRGRRAQVTVPVNHRRSPSLFLREEVRVVDNVYERQQPGTALLLAMRNPSVSAFCDTLRLHITVDGTAESVVYETEGAVYDGCDADYHILIPDTTLDLKGKAFTVKCEYKDQGVNKFMPLVQLSDEDRLDRQPTARPRQGILSVYDMHGICRGELTPAEIERRYPRLLRELPDGVYVVTQDGKSRKVAIQHQ